MLLLLYCCRLEFLPMGASVHFSRTGKIPMAPFPLTIFKKYRYNTESPFPAAVEGGFEKRMDVRGRPGVMINWEVFIACCFSGASRRFPTHGLKEQLSPGMILTSSKKSSILLQCIKGPLARFTSWARSYESRFNPNRGYTLIYMKSTPHIEGAYFTNNSIIFSFLGKRGRAEHAGSADGVKQGFTFQ